MPPRPPPQGRSISGAREGSSSTGPRPPDAEVVEGSTAAATAADMARREAAAQRGGHSEEPTALRMALRAVRSWLGLSRGGGWMVSLGLFCSAVLWVVCAVGLLDTQGTLVQRTFALLAGALAVLLTPYSGFGFRARAVHAIAPVIPRPIRLVFRDGSTLTLHHRPPHGLPWETGFEPPSSPRGGAPASPWATPVSMRRRSGSDVDAHGGASPLSSMSRDGAALSGLSSQAELACIAEISRALHISPCKGAPDDAETLEVQLVRFIREHGLRPRSIEKKFRAACEYKEKNINNSEVMSVLQPIASTRWMAASEMPDGEWATQYCPIGMHCGFAKNGCPVKIERLGRFDLKGITSTPNYRKKLNAFYLGLVDCLQRRLDQHAADTANLTEGQTYEIFDLAGLGTHMLTFSALNFTKDVLSAFATHYPSSFRKATVINAPGFANGAWRMVSTVLPKSVKEKVNIMGADYMDVLRAELTEEALYWVDAPNEELVHAPRRAGEAVPEPREEAAGAPAVAAIGDSPRDGASP